MALPPTYKAHLKEKIALTSKVRDFVFELIEPNTIDFKAGQFVLVKTHHPETGELISRAYSIASAPQEIHEIILDLEIVEGGKLTPLMDRWEVGYEAELQGPFGHFTVKSAPEKNILFISTGTGVAPFRSMIEDMLLRGDPRQLTLVMGVRNQHDIFYKELFEALAAKHANFTFILTLSRPEDGWSGTVGRVTAVVPALEFDPKTTDAYLCGGKPMIDEMKQLLMDKGLEKTQIYFEQYFL